MILRLRQAKFIQPLILNYNHTIVRYNSSLLNEAREKLKCWGGGKVHLHTDEESGIATITLDNQPKKNAISGSMMTQLETVVNKLEAWECGKGVVLKAAGDFFCSGGDISKEYNDFLTPHNGLLMSTFMHHTLTRLCSLPLVSVTLVNGKAIGGGAELTTVTDFRLFSASGEVCFVQGRMGLVTGWGGATRLVKILGPRLALDLLTSSRKLRAEEALKTGYADHLITGEDKCLETKDWLNKRLIHHHEVAQAMKKIIVGARDLNLEDSLLNERKIFSRLWGGPINLEAHGKKIKHK